MSIQQRIGENGKGKQLVAHEELDHRREESTPLKQVWEPPKLGWMKININGAYSEVSGRAGIGVIIRDHLGNVKLSAWKVIYGAFNAEETEALACREGILLATEWEHLPTILESDCSMVIQYLKEAKTMRPACHSIIQEAMRAASRLPVLDFSHIKRDINRVANELAQMAKRLNHSAVWYSRFLVCVEQFFFDTRHSPISITATEIPQYRVSRARLVGQKKTGRKGGGLPNLSQIRKHCKVKTQAFQVAAAPQSEYYTTSFNTKFTRLQR